MKKTIPYIFALATICVWGLSKYCLYHAQEWNAILKSEPTRGIYHYEIEGIIGTIIGCLDKDRFLELLKENAEYAARKRLITLDPLKSGAYTTAIGYMASHPEISTNHETELLPTRQTGLATNNIMIGLFTGRDNTNSNVILLGNFANTTNDNELVIRFADGTEFRHKLPTNTTVDLRGFSPVDPYTNKP